MIVGFNHNVSYRGVGFHVQTEDSGLKNPNLVTLLYNGGIIVASQKTSYADILTVDELDHVVEELAKEQHKGMLRRLTKGEFDQRICELGIALEGVTLAVNESAAIECTPQAELAATTVDGEEPFYADEEATLVAEDSSSAASEVPAAVAMAASLSIEPAFDPQTTEERNPRQNVSEALDDLIFSYLTGGDEKA